MSFPRIILFAIVFTAVQAAGQNVSVKATVDKNQILLGEPFNLSVETSFPANAISFFPAPVDSIPHIEILPGAVIDTIRSNDAIRIVAVYPLTSFDSGHWVITPIIAQPGIQTDTIGIDVVYSEFDPDQDYHEIKDIIDIKPKQKNKWWMYVIAGALLLGALGFWLLRRKKNIISPAKPLVVADPYEEAMMMLDLLQREQQDPKVFHSALVSIFRQYIFRRKGILSLQKTTDDLVLKLRDLGIEKNLFDAVTQALRLSDFVKFAKYVPSEDDNANCFDSIRNSIRAIEKNEMKTAETTQT